MSIRTRMNVLITTADLQVTEDQFMAFRSLLQEESMVMEELTEEELTEIIQMIKGLFQPKAMKERPGLLKKIGASMTADQRGRVAEIRGRVAMARRAAAMKELGTKGTAARPEKARYVSTKANQPKI